MESPVPSRWGSPLLFGVQVSERVAVVGSRHGADLAHVVALIEAMYEQQSDTVLVSGGAKGVDQLAESTWYRLGGTVCSYRPNKIGTEANPEYEIERWVYGAGTTPHVAPFGRVTFRDFDSAAFYRDWIIAEDATRLVAFFRRGGSRGTELTLSLAQSRKIPNYAFTA